MSFSTYWDLEPKSRAALSEADVQRYLDAELMLKGVLKVEPLDLDPQPEMPDMAPRTYYKASAFDALFTTAEDALAFARLKPLREHSEWLGNYAYGSVKHVEAAEPEGLTVVTVALPSKDSVLSAKAELERVAALKLANEKKREEHKKAVKLQNEALAGLWDDWHARRAESRQHQKVIDTYEAYVQTAGDHDVAAKFLLKVFSVEQIKDANEWTGVSIATEFALPNPGPSHPDAPDPAVDSGNISF